MIVANIVLGLQGGVAQGSEATFDGQPMQRGTHLRWSFLAALGFPPGGFWLCRRAASPGDRIIPPPPSVSTPATSGTTTSVTGVTQGNQWQATLPTPCQSVTLAGCAAPGCQEVIIETFSPDANGDLQVSGRRIVPVEQGSFRISVQAREISCVRVVGAGSVDECGCGTVEPPKDCGCGGQSGCGNPPCCSQPGWGTTNGNGWQCWGVPFTLPVTVANWPARYFGAPDPATTPAPIVEQRDIQEAARRLGGLQLAAGITPARQQAELRTLRAELVRLVQGFPSTLLANVPIPDSPAQANAPSLNMNLMQELLLLALDPYFARVLGLYFVDDQVAPGVQYDYSITGFWGGTPAQPSVIFPGLAPAVPLSRGSATLSGITVQSGVGTSFWRWLATPGLDPSAPPAAQTAVTASLSGIAQAQQPPALLIAVSKAHFFPFFEPANLALTLAQPMPRVDIQISGAGTVQALSGGTVVSSASFGSSQLTTVTVSNANSPIDQIQIVGTSATLVIGALTLYPLPANAIGTLYAIIPPPRPIQLVAAPGPAVSTFRHRQADIDTTALTLVPHSLIDVVWPAPAFGPAQQIGDPVTDPIQLPPPTQPIGFVTERQDSGVAGSMQRIPGWIATRSAPAPQQGSPVTTSNLYRLVDSQLPDPVGGWSYRVAGFDLFGALGPWSDWFTPRQVEKIAAAPTTVRIMKFDNTTASGGQAEADGSGWIGGTLNLIVNWSGAAFMMYPDIETARITVASIDESGNFTGQLTTSDIKVPAPSIQALTVSSIVATPSGDGYTFTVDIQTDPPLNSLGTFDPSQVLMLTLADGTTERFVVRPSNPLSPAPGPGVVSITAGNSARIVSTTNDFLGQPAYLVSGYGTQKLLPVPLEVPIAQTSARAQVSVTGSTQSPFLANEQIINPNDGSTRPEPPSVTLRFSGPQRLVPPVPATPVHEVDHVYYDPADATGLASKTLPFATPSVAGVSGYVLQRAPVRSLALADVKRRIAEGILADGEPALTPPRPDLGAWINSLSQWLVGYNAANGTS